MLGEQFNNTFFGNKAYIAPTEVAEIKDREDGFYKSRRNLNVINKNLSNWEADRPLQGMLFDPYTATGSGLDPLVNRDERIAAIDQAFRLGPEHRDQYKKTFRRYSNAPMGDIDDNLELLRNTAFDTNVPTDEFKRGFDTGRTVLVLPQDGRDWAYTGGSSNSTIKLNMRSYSQEETVPAHKKWVTEKGTEPLHNQKFWNWYDKNRYLSDTAYEVLPEQLLQYHWANPSTGEVFSESHPLHEKVYKDPQWPDLDVLRGAGFVPNMFPGKASEGKSHSSGDTEELYFGYGSRDEITRAVHQRFKPASAKQVDVPESTRWVSRKELDPTTLVHEMGHSQDKAWGRRGVTEGSDPRMEGIADGYELLHSSALASKALDLSMFPSVSSTGYGIHYFKTKPAQALYAATRAAILTTPDIDLSNISDYLDNHRLVSEHESMFPVKPTKPNNKTRPSRRAVRYVSDYEANFNARERTKDRQQARTNTSMLLGHMVEHYPHIMPYLQQVGLDKHAIGAHNEYTAVRQRLETKGDQVDFMYRSQKPPTPEVPAEYNSDSTDMSESQWEHQHDYDKDFGFRQRRTSQIPGQMELF